MTPPLPAAALRPPPADWEAVDRTALGALREELELDPKPGLVSPRDPGAHRDMDAATFRRSLAALRGAFGAAAAAGAAGLPFAELRRLGVEAEARMLAATAGVNTHRGAIFALGLLCAAAGRLRAAGRAPAGDALGREVAAAFGPSLRGGAAPGPSSHGAAVARWHGAGGAREEAAAGFPHLFGVALPALEEGLARGEGRRAAAAQCLLALVAALPDTNLLWRGGAEGLRYAQGAARGFLAAGGVHRRGWEARLAALHREFRARRLSPGGSADLLAAALLVHDLRAAPAASPR